ncbi:MAG: hypothetical protein Q8Q73_14795 [Stagnimonas sp.]|nr:hypothetical protein [Stagnimonas sp.]
MKPGTAIAVAVGAAAVAGAAWWFSRKRQAAASSTAASSGGSSGGYAGSEYSIAASLGLDRFLTSNGGTTKDSGSEGSGFFSDRYKTPPIVSPGSRVMQ